MSLVYLHPGWPADMPLPMRSSGSGFPVDMPLPMSPEPRVVEVTPREKQVVEALMIDGDSNETVGRRVNLTAETVKTHLRGVYRKTGISARAALVLEIERRHLVLVAVNKRNPLK